MLTLILIRLKTPREVKDRCLITFLINKYNSQFLITAQAGKI